MTGDAENSKEPKSPGTELSSIIDSWNAGNANYETAHYDYAGSLYRKLDDQSRINIISQSVSKLRPINAKGNEQEVLRLLCHFFRSDMQFGMNVAGGLGIDLRSLMSSMPAGMFNAR